MQGLLQVKASNFRIHFNPISSAIADCMHSTYCTEMETGEYSRNDAIYHAIDSGKDELKYGGYNLIIDTSEKEFDIILEELLYSKF